MAEEELGNPQLQMPALGRGSSGGLQPLLATCGADHIVHLWNADTLAAVRSLTGHSDWVYAIAFSPDGNLIASGSWNGEVKVWKVADGTLVKSFTGSPGIVAANAPKK